MNNISPAVYYSYPAGQSATLDYQAMFKLQVHDFFDNISGFVQNPFVIKVWILSFLAVVLYCAWVSWRMEKTK